MSNNVTDLGKGSIPKLIFKLATPAIIAQLVNVLYNIVDRIFIGRMQGGDIAMAGVGVAFPITLIVAAFAALVGMGGAPLAAIKMGEKDNDGAEKIMSNSFSTLVLLAILLTLVFLVFKEPLLWAFGASEATIGYAMDYLSIYLIGTIFVLVALGMNPFINTQGFAKIGMMTVSIGAAMNIILDPILIFGLDMGVRGAATATIISQAISAMWVLRFLLSGKATLKIRKKYLKIDFRIMGRVMGLGVAPFIMQATESLVLITLNTKLQMYGGDLAVGAMTIMSSIMQIIMLPTMGVTQGSQPIMSYNYGAKQIGRVKKAFKLTILITLGYTATMCTALMIMPEMFVRIFNSDPKLVEITVWSIRIYFVGITIFGIQVACQNTLLALGQAKISLFLALLRKVILLIPLIYILPTFMENKLFAVLLAQPIADITAVITTAICFMVFYKRNLSNIESKSINTNDKESLNTN
ncbi:MATE family efflux transporter [Romboutsia hominis]|uniref:Multidrug export protein MepA n=1 Tax=Romboutsia hominis TaxID=1507512 RepID=A0A2P2BNH8_9FIRM|nr:MATE family efflux transporter [Romboutsia hominis]MCH1959399.1 MATE family efflux transporter [Romboutsia hominis]MCH1970298.1 MATE family efflux transporter [Romboutsia hominis]CEI71945.1 Mate efflux protein [Romboutsia hominis]